MQMKRKKFSQATAFSIFFPLCKYIIFQTITVYNTSQAREGAATIIEHENVFAVTPTRWFNTIFDNGLCGHTLASSRISV